MGFDKYRRAPLTSFEKYYEEFLQNSLHRKRWKIESPQGDFMTGIPTVGSLVNPNDPDVSFFFKADDGVTYRIPYRDLKEANPVDKE